MKTNYASEDNKLLASAAVLVAEMLGIKTKQKREKRRKEL